MRRLCSLAILSLYACGSSTGSGGPTAPAAAAAAATPSAPSTDAALDPPAPKLRLPRHFLPTAVSARLGIDPAAAGFSGAVEITGTLSERASRIWLHARGLTIKRAVAVQGPTRVELTFGNDGEELLWLRAATPLAAGTWVLSLQYDGNYETVVTVGAIKQTVDNRAYITTQFESIFARRVFPCFDEPNVKVPWQLTLDVPVDDRAFANTPSLSETALDATHKRVVFAPTKPLPSYLVAFGVGPFEIVDAGKAQSGAPLRVIALAGRAADAQWAAQTSAPIVNALEDWFGMPYPYEKLDMLTIPVSSGFGAMENPGLITYAGRLILHDPKTITKAQRFAWVDVAGHEVAHQWFGDLVTPMYWDDIWLNEGFARWMEPKVAAALEGKLPGLEGKLGAAFMANQYREIALNADRTVNARRVRQAIESPGDIYSAFDGITYDKGASILAMFEHAVGAETMQRGVRAYLAKHKYGNATSADFVASISEAAKRDLAPAFSSFLDQAGAPLVQGELQCASGAVPALRLTQQRFVVPGSAVPEAGKPWSIPVCVAFDRDGKRAEACTTLDGASVDLALDAKACPRWVMLNAGGYGYYRSGLPAASYQAVRDLAWKSLTPVERFTVFTDTSALAFTGQVDVGLPLSLVPLMLAEKHRFAVGGAAGLAERLRAMVSPGKRPAYDAWIRASFGPMARSLGWAARRADSLDVEATRRTLLELVAWAGDAPVRAGAVTLAKAWRGVDSAMREVAWGVAADTSPATFDTLMEAVVTEPDADVRLDLLGALAQVRDEPRLRAVLALLFDRRIDVREAQRVLSGGGDDPQRVIVARYFQEHFDPLMKRLPTAGPTGSAARLSALFTQLCDAARRDEIIAYVNEHFGNQPDARRVVSQNLERMDQCIAAKASLGPRVEAWLTTKK
jgi:cytosol alanyl aminopeptidase